METHVEALPEAAAAEAAPLPTETPQTPEAGAETVEMSMGDALASMDKRLAPGRLVSGRVTRIEKDGVLVDVGHKSDGIIRLSELSPRYVEDPNTVVSVGDEIEVVVLKSEDSEGNLLLSLKRATQDASWKKVTEALENNTILTGTAVEQVKGGLIVDLGLRGFLPASQVDLRPVRDLADFVGELMQLRVLEIDRQRRKVVVSRKKVLEEEREASKSASMSQLHEGQVVRGTVARLTAFGAFINLGGVDGLVHISEISHRRIKTPADVLTVGDAVDVLVLKLDKKKDRISLSLRQARPDPWLNIDAHFQEGQKVKGTVSRTAKNYVFVELLDGLEGLIHFNELGHDRSQKLEEAVTVGQELEVKVVRVNAAARRIELSVRQLRDGMPSDYRQQAAPGQFTMAQLLKDKFTERGITSLDAHLRGEGASNAETAAQPESL